MIIGRDIMHSLLGINLLFDTAEISWDNAKIHMQHPEVLKDRIEWMPWNKKYIMHTIQIQRMQKESKVLLSLNTVKAKPTTVRNPQANAIVERVHQVIGNIICTFELENNYLDDNDPWKGILSATAFAVQSTFHTTLQNTPGQLVFGCDMILNVKHDASWEYICARKQNIILKNCKAEIAKRIPHTYNIVIKFYSKEEQKINMRHLSRVLLLSPK
jgi:hypothetical protein